MAQEPIRTKAGAVRIVDSSNFPAAKMIAAGLVEVEPGGMRELHWHPKSDELQYYIEGEGRMTVYASNTNASTFDYQGGDVGYVPKSMPHYIENTGATKLRYLELWQSDRFSDVSLAQWLAFTPYELVKVPLLGVDVDDLEARDGRIVSRSDPARAMAFRDVAANMRTEQLAVLAHGAPGLRRSRWPSSRTRMNKIRHSGYRFPPEIIQQALWLRLRFTLSVRDVEDLLAERGVAVSYETVRRWVNHFGRHSHIRQNYLPPASSRLKPRLQQSMG